MPIILMWQRPVNIQPYRLAINYFANVAAKAELRPKTKTPNWTRPTFERSHIWYNRIKWSVESESSLRSHFLKIPAVPEICVNIWSGRRDSIWEYYELNMYYMPHEMWRRLLFGPGELLACLIRGSIRYWWCWAPSPPPHIYTCKQRRSEIGLDSLRYFPLAARIEK